MSRGHLSMGLYANVAAMRERIGDMRRIVAEAYEDAVLPLAELAVSERGTE